MQIGNGSIKLIQGDITEQRVDVIVNAANKALRGGGGVDGAIHRAGGPEILEDCYQYANCPTGSARVTTAGKLHAKYVFHAVGPRYRGGERGEEALLTSAYRTCLELAGQYKVKSIAFPAISAGIYGYPLKEAARVAVSQAVEYLHTGAELEIMFILFDAETFGVFEAVLNDMTQEQS